MTNTQAARLTLTAIGASDNVMTKSASANSAQQALIERPCVIAKEGESSLLKLASVLASSDIADELVGGN